MHWKSTFWLKCVGLIQANSYCFSKNMQDAKRQALTLDAWIRMVSLDVLLIQLFSAVWPLSSLSSDIQATRCTTALKCSLHYGNIPVVNLQKVIYHTTFISLFQISVSSIFPLLLFWTIYSGMGKRTSPMECEGCTNEGCSAFFSCLDTRYLRSKQVTFHSVSPSIQ